MSAAYATFGLAPAVRAGGVLANGAYQAHRDFLDFMVDGSPLLFQLSDLDAVSPLAADVPPAIFTAAVRGLLLQEEAPLRDGRHIIYGCPECEGLECGAVTAVIEPAGDDFVWRDFAWQTSEPVDLEWGGYHGIGPFLFEGGQYRGALAGLLDAEPAAERRRVLLIGPRVAALARLAAALRTTGVGAEITGDVSVVPAEELRTYGAVVFGVRVDACEKAAVRASFERAHADVAYVDGVAPVVPVLVAQIEQALDRGRARLHRLAGLVAAEGAADIEVTSTCRVRLTAYRLDRLSRTHVHEVYEGVLEPGIHRVPLDAKAARGETYLVARATDSVLVASPAR
ncbi:oxidoreductase [Streptomyces tsukubensis]|uniref:Oxidoreductase n=1 Tax=Streptomyces tsukubensis TaxID=83656 RepID=A0A1V4ADJ3_9ACTN|nr:oxidoreductase [Streptomyces tsukubensis]OON81830.1 oxidoreductase [Streptomyces tsukubensis]QFR96619.1 oxidoreductase [Streptomyces tsukubensis]